MKGNQGTQGFQGKSLLVNSSIPLNFRFTEPNGAGFESSNDQYTRTALFIYGGTDSDNVISRALAIMYTTDIDRYYRLRIEDLTNAMTIAESAPDNTGTNGAPAIIDLGTISNLPTGQSLFEIQILATDATGTQGIQGPQAVGIHTIQLYA